MRDRPWRWFWAHHRRPALLVLVAALVSTGSSLALLGVAFLVRRALEVAIPGGRSSALLACAGGIALVFLVHAALRAAAMHWVLGELKHAIQRVREDLLRHLYALPRAAHAKLEVGRLHAVLLQGTFSLDGLSYALLGQLIPGAIVSATLGALLLAINLRLALVMLGLLPVLALLGRTVGGRVKRAIQRALRARDELSHGTLFALQALETTRARGAEAQELARQSRIFESARRTSHLMLWGQNVYRLLQETAVALFVIATVIVSGLALEGRRITVNEMVLVYVVLTLMRSHLADVLLAIPAVIEGVHALDAVQELRRLEAAAPYAGTRAIPFEGRVRLEDVTFGYGERPVFRGVNLETAPGRIVAIVGRNGAGKTTLGSLVLGLYRPTAGRLTADGVPYDELCMNGLRRAMGHVPQDPFLFAGTILENVVYGVPEAREADVEAACRVATVDEIAGALPLGLRASIGDAGVLLSGGQRQRIAVARALLGNPRLLILDEPTHNLDPATTERLLRNLRQLSVAILVFTHDEAVVREADEVHRLDEAGLAAVRR